MNKALLICGHGSKKGANTAFIQIVNSISFQYPDFTVAEAYLEYQQPDIAFALQNLADSGATEIIIVPVFLFTGVHIEIDIPALVANFKARNTNISVKISDHIGLCDDLVMLCEKRIAKAEEKLKPLPRSSTALLLVGVGASVTKANVDIAGLTRLVWENSGFGFAQYAFVSKQTMPKPIDILNYLDYLSYSRIIVLPALLFNGIYLNEIKKVIEQKQLLSNNEIVLTEIFEDDILIQSVIFKRINDTMKASSSIQ